MRLEVRNRLNRAIPVARKICEIAQFDFRPGLVRGLAGCGAAHKQRIQLSRPDPVEPGPGGRAYQFDRDMGELSLQHVENRGQTISKSGAAADAKDPLCRRPQLSLVIRYDRLTRDLSAETPGNRRDLPMCRANFVVSL